MVGEMMLPWYWNWLDQRVLRLTEKLMRLHVYIVEYKCRCEMCEGEQRRKD